MSGIETAFFGVLATEAEQKTSKADKPYLRLRVRVGDGDSAQWLSVVSFDEQAICTADKLIKGSRIYCEGRLSFDTWTSADGTAKSGISVMAWHTRLSQIGRQKPKRERERAG